MEIMPGSEVRIEVRRDPKAADTIVVSCEARFPKAGVDMVKRSLTRQWRRVADKNGARLEALH